MENVLIIKIIGTSNNIYKYAKKSFDAKMNGGINKEKSYYGLSKDKSYPDGSQVNIEDTGLILFCVCNTNQNSYCDSQQQIEEMFIGKFKIGKNKENENNYETRYKIFVNLKNNECNKDSKAINRAIESIVSKIDLDIENDFSNNTYVAFNNMKSLYVELMERINAELEKK